MLRLMASIGTLIMAFCCVPGISCQEFEQTAPDKYRIEFTDKDESGYSVDNPEEFLSPAAIERRHKHSIPITESDFPVHPAYLNLLEENGAKVLTTSRWFNSATIEVSDSSVLQRITLLHFVKQGFTALHSPVPAVQKQSGIMSSVSLTEPDYGPSWLQTSLHNGNLLHNNGYTGNGMTIAVIDAGFANVDTLPFFDRLFENAKILGTRDFVKPGNNVYREATHGMSVLSLIGGYQPGGLIGTAPDASFWLLRSEDGGSEFIIEEDNWIAAAEFADSAGADILNTSLGYSVFNDSVQNHTYDDMDGNTTRVSRAADIAASKGMMIIVSAGNQGNVQWKYITAPADADSVLTVGAIDRSKAIASFSSRGPSSDGQVKPNVVSIGQGVYVGNVDGNIRPGNGTSFSAPIITGLTACLWQANRDAKAGEIYSAIIESADRFYNPDDEYGYGVPDFHLADILLKARKQGLETDAHVTAFPNPFNNRLYVFFKEPVNSTVTIRLFDLAGKEVFRKDYPAVADREFLIIDEDFDSIQKGVYIIRIVLGNLSGNSKLIKY